MGVGLALLQPLFFSFFDVPKVIIQRKFTKQYPILKRGIVY